MFTFSQVEKLTLGVFSKTEGVLGNNAYNI